MSVPGEPRFPRIGVLLLSGRLSGRNWFPVVWQKLGNAVNRISGNSGKHVFEPGERQWECIAARGKLHTLPLTGCVEAAQDGCCLATPVTTEELAARRQRQSRSKGRRDPLNRGILPTARSPAEGVFARDLARPRRSQALRDRSTYAQPLGIGPNLIPGFAVRLPRTLIGISQIVTELEPQIGPDGQAILCKAPGTFFSGVSAPVASLENFGPPGTTLRRKTDGNSTNAESVCLSRRRKHFHSYPFLV